MLGSTASLSYISADCGRLRKCVRLQETRQVSFKVSSMGAEGRGKIRFIGGWAIRKSLEKSRRYATENHHSQSKEVIGKVVREMRKASVLQNDVIVSPKSLREISEIPETLDLTESRQYREHGLLDISDNAYYFFMLLEQQRVDQINADRFCQLRSNIITKIYEKRF